MGKGDRKSKRGKIWRGTTGKRRPGSQKLRKLKKERKVHSKWVSIPNLKLFLVGSYKFIVSPRDWNQW